MGKIVLGIQCNDEKVAGRFEMEKATDKEIAMVITALELQKRKLLRIAEKNSDETAKEVFRE